MILDEFRIIMIAGLLPSAILMYLIYRADRVEKEPLGLLLKIFLLGCLTVVPALILEMAGEFVLDVVPVARGTGLSLALEMFLVVGISEELVKYVNTRICTWNHPAFNYRFDGVVYCAVASLGFASAENLLYIAGRGLYAAPIRAVTSIPLHCICGVFMGHYYGMDKYYCARGMHRKGKLYSFLSLFIPVLIHGFYDFVAAYGSSTLTAVFYIFIITMDVIAIQSVRKYALEDTEIFFE